MIMYILGGLKPWIVHHHGLAGLSDKFSPGKVRADVPTVTTGGKWWSAAAFELAKVEGVIR